MNTGQRNVHGRTIYQGVRGGKYVLVGGRKVYQFTAAPATVAVAPAAATHNRHGRLIHTGARGGRYVMIGGRRVYRIETGPPAAPPPSANKLELMNGIHVNKRGKFYAANGSEITNRDPRGRTRAYYYTTAYNKKQNFLNKNVLPFVAIRTPRGYTRSARIARATQNSPFGNTRYQSAIFYKRSNGSLYYVRYNGKPIPVMSQEAAPYGIRVRTNATYRAIQRQIANENASFPRHVIPGMALAPLPLSPVRYRTNAELANMILNRVYTVGRGGTVNASNLTANEKERAALRLKAFINQTIESRNTRRATANAARARGNMAAAAAAMERVGYYNNMSRAIRRGYRAVKPLSGRVTTRITNATPNRWTPAPPGEENVVLTGNLNTPHMVIKVPGTKVLYMNPNSLIGLIKNATGANIAPNNLRNWLRVMRRNHGNEPLFRHIISRNKNVTARHIRFSR